ncbi:MAG: thioredoxin family protein [Sneathiellaceae bacterium]
MAATESQVCDFGRSAVAFDLFGVDNRRHSLADIRGEKGTLVMFICNHCPYVRRIIEPLVQDVHRLMAEGIGAVAIMPNDTDAYPDDSFEMMRHHAIEWGFGFPYVIDEQQTVARAYGAICTPDFFGYNADLKLQYRGRFDDGSGGSAGSGRHELLEAMRQIAETGEGPREQTASIGCSIKWRSAA